MVKKSIILLTILASVLTACSDYHSSKKSNSVSFDLDSIRKRDKLIAVTDYNSVNYFIYKGEPMGFNYELLKSFSDHIGIDLEIITENNLDRAFNLLNEGDADLLAIGLTVNASRKKDMLFTDPIAETRQVLVQRKPRYWRSLTYTEIEKSIIRNQLDLAKKSVYVRKGSSHVERLHSLAAEIGDSITIIEIPYESEQLIKLVVDREIDYAVCDENIARVNATYYPDIDVNTPISFNQNLAWGLRSYNSDKLLQELNKWIRTFRSTESYAILYAKYFKNSRSNIIVKSDYYTLNTGKVSPWDDMIKGYSDSISWDWRLLASLIYQESRFKPNVVSWAGAFGLMQIMPETGKYFGVDITSSPGNNIRAGTSYINWLHSIFDPKIPDEHERLKFILASYNAGPGHVLDAMKLAEKNGKDPQKWEDNVAIWMLKKSEPQYYNDEDVKNGYFRGTESVAFVDEILERFERYKNIIPAKSGRQISQTAEN
ncbi:MAG: transporter substrate-binding domain-containing protein [Bacteroidales bacterium]|nr:transporter substrate-binding domain-containing protein [Bacteroidales bacterium]